jgi:DNA polymerase-3 subunit delta'
MNIISKAFDTHSLPHSILLLGDDNDLKLQEVLEFIKKYYDAFHISQRIDAESFLDLKILNPKDDMIKIDEIRDVMHFAYLSPIESDTKFIIIIEAERMNLNAANSLLKLLEEPPLNTYIFLLASHQDSLLKTIVSRCVKLYIPNSTEDIGHCIEHEQKLRSLLEDSKDSSVMSYINSITSKTAVELWHGFTQAYLLLLSNASKDLANSNLMSNYLDLYDEALNLFASEKRLNLDRKIIAVTLIAKLKQTRDRK